jgi:hypothetical protein
MAINFTPGVLAPTTAAAVDRLKGGGPGDIVTEREMSTVVGLDCSPRGPGYSTVYRATQIVRRDQQIVWQRDRTIPGWRVLTAEERIQQVKTTGMKSIRRKARKHLDMLAVASKDLSPDSQRDQKILQVTQGMVLMTTTGHFRTQIAATVAEYDKLAKPTAPALIELMRSNHKP